MNRLSPRYLSKAFRILRQNVIFRNKSDEVTHTGQSYDPTDFRNVRFTDKEKLVNKQFAIKLIDEIPPIPSKSKVVACDGGDPALGHPKVYINLDKPGNHICGYCGLRYYLDDHH